MKLLHKKLLSFLLALSIVLLSIFACPLSVYATSSGVHPDPDKPLGNILVEGAKHAVMYIISQIGAVADGNFFNYMQNKATWNDYWNGDNIKEVTDDSGNVVSYTFSEELMAYIKQCLDDYAAENQPFVIKPTYKYSDVPASNFRTATDYNTFRSYAYSHDLTYFLYRYDYNGRLGDMYLGDLTEEYKKGGGFIFTSIYQNDFYMSGSDWSGFTLPCMYYVEEKGEDGNISFSEPIEKNLEFKGTGVADFCGYREGLTNFKVSNVNSKVGVLITKDGGRIRVFKSKTAFMDYSAGQRKIYYTSNYYNYVPEDLQVSIDDLQKTIDDMQDVIDKLLEQITGNTSESEIEELLRKILEALENNPGGGGGGSGGGDVNVDIDLSSTNSLLSKILAKITQIYDKMNAAVEDAESAAMAKMQESLDEIVEQLKKIKHWTIADTVIDAADAVADWADLILGVLKDAKEGAGSAVAAVAGTLGDSVDLMAKKFPFSIPWDILFFVSVLSAEPQMPHFEIPFNIELSMLGITIDYTMELDFSQFRWLSDLSRLIFSMIYAVGLMKMTFGVTSAGKEE